MTRKEELEKLFKDNLPKGLPKSTKKILDKAAAKFAETLQNYYELPCALGDAVVDIKEYFDGTENPQAYRYTAEKITVMQDGDEIVYLINDEVQCKKADFGKTIFFGEAGEEQAAAAALETTKPSAPIGIYGAFGGLEEYSRLLEEARRKLLGLRF